VLGIKYRGILERSGLDAAIIGCAKIKISMAVNRHKPPLNPSLAGRQVPLFRGRNLDPPRPEKGKGLESGFTTILLVYQT
jgi:hypothetical protein